MIQFCLARFYESPDEIRMLVHISDLYVFIFVVISFNFAVATSSPSMLSRAVAMG